MLIVELLQDEARKDESKNCLPVFGQHVLD